MTMEQTSQLLIGLTLADLTCPMQSNHHLQRSRLPSPAPTPRVWTSSRRRIHCWTRTGDCCLLLRVQGRLEPSCTFVPRRRNSQRPSDRSVFVNITYVLFACCLNCYCRKKNQNTGSSYVTKNSPVFSAICFCPSLRPRPQTLHKMVCVPLLS